MKYNHENLSTGLSNKMDAAIAVPASTDASLVLIVYCSVKIINYLLAETGNCIRVFSAAFSSNLGEFLTNK